MPFFSIVMAFVHFLACSSLCWRAWKWTRAHPAGFSAANALRKPATDTLITGSILLILSLASVAQGFSDRDVHWKLNHRFFGYWTPFIFLPAILFALALPLLPCLGLKVEFRDSGDRMFMASMGGAIFSLMWPFIYILITLLFGPPVQF